MPQVFMIAVHALTGSCCLLAMAQTLSTLHCFKGMNIFINESFAVMWTLLKAHLSVQLNYFLLHIHLVLIS